MKNLVILMLLIFAILDTYGQKSDTIELNGANIYYEIHGEGEPLLVLHWYMGSNKIYDRWLEEWSEKYQLILPDLRGHGKSTNPKDIFRHRDVAEDMYALMDYLKIKKFKALGASTGGMTLIHMATMDTSRILSMVLIGATSYYPVECRTNMLSYKVSEWEEYKWMNKHVSRGEEQIKKLIYQFNELSDVYDDMNFTPDHLAKIKCPVLIIHGDRDEYFSIDIPVEMYKSIPNSYLWILPNGWHIPPIWGSKWSAIFSEIAMDFLNGEFVK
jgi:pimeloyl-ACP methyl ester carboxylesterase